MRNKKSKEPEKSAEEQALEQRVDAMMNPNRDDENSSSATVPVSSRSKPVAKPTDFSHKQPSAPLLPSRLHRQLEASKIPQQRLSSDKLSALTGDVAGTRQIPASKTLQNQPDSLSSTNLDDTVTDKIVDDIVAKEGDLALAVDDARAVRRNQPVSRSSWKSRLQAVLKSKWTWGVIVMVLLLVMGLPLTRYKILGLVVKKPVIIGIIDSKTLMPVSNAQVLLGSQAGKTDDKGRIQLNIPVGPHTLTVTKKYYKTSRVSYFTGFKSTPLVKVTLVATGRLVPLSVVDRITGKPLPGVEVRALGTTTQTDARGRASIALPTKNSTNKAKLQLIGYNTSTVDLHVTDQLIKANSFELTPNGHVYFLSNQAGTVDVVRTNLDGTDRHIIVEGTGHEDKNSTSLLASRDWRYLVLEARRDDGAQPALFLINTQDDTITQFDNSDASFTLVGWYGHSFIYTLTRTGLSPWQSGRELLKSYDADNQQLNQLDQNQAEGSAASYAYQTFLNFSLVRGMVAYNTQWHSDSGSGASNLSSKTDSIRAIQPTGQNKKDYQTFAADVTGSLQAVLYKPQAMYYAVHNDTDNQTAYYVYDGEAVKSTATSEADFTKGYPAYLFSPSGQQTFWRERRGGAYTLLTGDGTAKSQKSIVSPSEYTPYGWYSDAYVLVSNNDSELYIMPVTGLAPSRQPLKIADYYRPATPFAGSGYSYGGL